MNEAENKIAESLLMEMRNANADERRCLIADYRGLVSAAALRAEAERVCSLDTTRLATGIRDVAQPEAPRPTIGRIVHYTVSEQDREEIYRRRTTGASIAERIQEGKWPVGAQAHIGNFVGSCEVYPAMVVSEGEGNVVNLRVFLDGTDTFWATSRDMEDPDGPRNQPGTWHWPQRA